METPEYLIFTVNDSAHDSVATDSGLVYYRKLWVEVNKPKHVFPNELIQDEDGNFWYVRSQQGKELVIINTEMLDKPDNTVIESFKGLSYKNAAKA